MSHKDRFGDERYRVERVLEVLDTIAARLEARDPVPLSLLGDAVEFIRASEASAYEASQTNEEEPALSACIEQHYAARVPVHGMEQTLQALQAGEPAASDRFAQFAREYARLRRDHMRLDDRLCSNAVRRVGDGSETPAQSAESLAIRQAYDRLIEASAALTGSVRSAPSHV